MSIKEGALTTVTETDIGANDFVRVLDGDSSRKITTTDFADVMSPLLQNLGFLTASGADSSTVFQKVLTISTNYNLVASDSIILCDTSGGVIGINLPTASSVWSTLNEVGQQFTVKRITTDVNKVTVTPAGTETIDGNESFDLVGPNLVSITFVSSGTGWHIVS